MNKTDKCVTRCISGYSALLLFIAAVNKFSLQSRLQVRLITWSPLFPVVLWLDDSALVRDPLQIFVLTLYREFIALYDIDTIFYKPHTN